MRSAPWATTTATKRVLVRNSWGPAWGKKGYFTMPYDYVANRDLSDDFWTIRAGATRATWRQKEEPFQDGRATACRGVVTWP
jgi:hypothetical protein